MNPAQTQTRVIDGTRYNFEKVCRRKGKVKHLVFRSDEGAVAYIPPSQTPPKGNDTRGTLVGSLLAFLRH